MEKYIGYGYTNSQGIATLDYDANGTQISTLAPTGSSGYIGSGGGEIDIKAKLHDDSTVQSEPFEVTDCMVYDAGVSGKANANAWSDFDTSRIRTTVGATGTLVENLYTGQVALSSNRAGTTTASPWDYIPPFCVEVDFQNATQNKVYVQVHNSDNSTVITIPFQNQSDFQHIKLLVRTDKTQIWVDGVKGSDLSGISPSGTRDTLEVRFILDAGCEFTFRNFEIYPM